MSTVMNCRTRTRPTRTRSRTVRVLLAFMAAVLVGLAPGMGQVAQAVPPMSNVYAGVTDQAGVLTSSQVYQVESAISQATSRTGYNLHVVYVKSFDGLSGQAWAQQTAEQSWLGSNDMLLAVAVTDRLWGFMVSDNSSISNSQVAMIENAITGKLSSGDYAGAAIAGARAIAATANASPSSSSSSSSSDGSGSLLIILVIVFCVVIICVAATRGGDQTNGRSSAWTSGYVMGSMNNSSTYHSSYHSTYHGSSGSSSHSSSGGFHGGGGSFGGGGGGGGGFHGGGGSFGGSRSSGGHF